MGTRGEIAGCANFKLSQWLLMASVWFQGQRVSVLGFASHIIFPATPELYVPCKAAICKDGHDHVLMKLYLQKRGGR